MVHPCLLAEHSFVQELDALLNSSAGTCLERRSFASAALQQAPQGATVAAAEDGSYRFHQLPIYVTHAPFLTSRRQHVERRLAAIGANDVTFITCANKEDVRHFTAEQRACLYAPTRNPFDHGKGTIANGTLSLALKHKLAYRDLLRRQLLAALIIEDDAGVPANMWARLSALAVPADTDIFYLGSYQGLTNWNVLKWDPVVNGTHPPVHRRDCRSRGKVNNHFGTIAYIVFARAAHRMLRSVRVAADSGLSALNCSYPPNMRCDYCSDTPPNQYGPSSWIVAPFRTAESNTHRDSHG